MYMYGSRHRSMIFFIAHEKSLATVAKSLLVVVAFLL